MRLNIPCSPFDVIIAVVRKPQRSPCQLSLRGLLALVVIAAACAWGGIGVFDSYACRPTTKTYYVGDLLPPGARLPNELPKFAAKLKSSVVRDMWWSHDREVTPFFLSISLIVRDSAAGHQRVEAWLSQQRRAAEGRLPEFRSHSR